MQGSEVASKGQTSTHSGLNCLSLLLGFYQIPTDVAQLKHAVGSDVAVEPRDMVRLARQMGAKATIRKVNIDKLTKTPLPLIARGNDGEYFLVAAIRDNQVLIQPAEGAPQTLGFDELAKRWSGEAVLVTTRETLASTSRFDVTWFIPALVKYRKLLAEVLLASLVLQLFALATPLVFQVIIDKVLVHKGLDTLYVLAAALIGVVIFETLMGGIRSYVFSHTTCRVDVELGAKLYAHLLKLPLSYFEARRVGDSVARVRELDTIREFLTSSSVTLVIDLLFTVIFLAVMWFYSPWLLLIVVAAIILYTVICLAITPALRRRIDERFQRGAENQAFLVETVSGIQTLKAGSVEPQMQNRWEKMLAAYIGTGFSVAKLNVLGGQAIQLVNKLSTALILFFGAKMAIDGDMTVGELVAFNMLASRVSEPVLRLAGLWQQFQEAQVGINRLGDILNTPTEASFSPSRAALPQIRGEITLDHVTFRYQPGGREILRDVSLTVKPGEIIGVVGPSGSGKSTLTKLIQRLYIPEAGRVLIDGVDLALVDPAWLRRQIGVVLQENLLFNRTIRENIALANPALPLESVMAAASLAGAHDFILELPEGYDTRIEERGTNLSGGQRQRIAIARALISNPRILILDEATSALDAESEAIIQANMRSITRGRTVIIIAHRLSAIRMASRIITMENGMVTEEGSHNQLIAANGRYASLWALQTQGWAQ